VIDADKLAHRCLRQGSPVYKRIAAAFGPGILRNSGSIDRAKLACIVFNDKRSLLKLNRMCHPAVIREIKKKIASAKQDLVVLDAALLIEAGLGSIVDKLAVVRVTRARQLERIRRKYPAAKTSEMLKRIKCQLSQEKKVRLADFIIDNNGNIAKTRKQVHAIRRLLWRNWR
jgi:dephospho-CoA kinase